MTRLPWRMLLVLGQAAGFACTAPPPRAPICDAPAPPQASVCHVAGDWCAYNSTCCSDHCESESSVCH
jgi:hypothetical protein